MKQAKETIIQTEQQEQEVEIQEEGKSRGVLNTVVNVILVLAIALAAICTYVSYVSTSGNGVPSVLGIRMFSIQTQSMYPTLLPGDLIFDTAVNDPSELRKDDIITYWTVINGERVLNTHRIYEVYDGGGYLIFSTKGDKNTAADALTVHESEVVGKYAFRVPGLGKVFDYLQTSTGFLLVVVLPVFLFFLFHLVQFFRVLFEYQNVKNRIKYELERGRTEDLIAEQERRQKEAQTQARAAMEAELRERLRAELLASMKPQDQSVDNGATAEPETIVQTEPVEEESFEAKPVEDEPTSSEEVAAAERVGQNDQEKAADAEQPKEDKPTLDEAAIEAIIAKQREAIEAELREKLRAEIMANMENTAAAEKPEQKSEDTTKV